MRTRSAIPYLILCLALSAGSARAAGETAAQAAEAREHFAQGSRLYDLSEYEKALSEFKEAYRLVDDPAFLFNIAQCHRLLGHRDEAITFFKRYLRRSPKAAKNRAEIERRIAELEKEKAAAPPKVAEPAPVSPAPPPATTPPAAPAAPVESAADLGARAPAGGAPAVTLTATSAPERDDSPPFYGRAWFWVGAGVVVLGAAAAIVLLGSRGGGDSGNFCPDCDATGGISPR